MQYGAYRNKWSHGEQEHFYVRKRRIKVQEQDEGEWRKCGIEPSNSAGGKTHWVGLGCKSW